MSLQERADHWAAQYGVDPALFRGLIQQESAWRPDARSPVGAQGLTQVMPATGRSPGFGVTPIKNIDDPEDQLRFGAEYLAAMMKRYDGDANKALAAYNWGAGNADKWSGDMASLPAETRDYIPKVMGYAGLGGGGGGSAAAPQAAAEAGLAEAELAAAVEPPPPAEGILAMLSGRGAANEEGERNYAENFMGRAARGVDSARTRTQSRLGLDNKQAQGFGDVLAQMGLRMMG